MKKAKICKLLSVFLLLVMMFSIVPIGAVTASAATDKVAIYSSNFNHLPKASVTIDGVTYKRYMHISGYDGLAPGAYIYVDSQDNLVTDVELLKKLAFASSIELGFPVLLQEASYVNDANDKAMDVINQLGNSIVEKTISNAIVANFKGILSILSGNAANGAKAYLEFVKNAAIDEIVYMSYLLVTCDLADAVELEYLEFCKVYNSMINHLYDDGITYTEAVKFEEAYRKMMTTIKVTEDLLITLAESVMGGKVNSSRDALDILKNLGLKSTDEIITKLIESAYEDGFIEAIQFCADFNSLFNMASDYLSVNNKLKYYKENLQVLDPNASYYVDVDQIVENNEIITGQSFEDVEDTDDTESSVSVSEANYASIIAELKESYPNGKYWNNYNGTVSSGALKGTSLAGSQKCKCTSTCPTDCSCKCGTFRVNGTDYAWQCHGYALLMAYKVFGSNINTDSSHWAKISSLGSYNFCAGDVVRVGNHTIFIYKVDGNTVYYTDANYTGPCQIRWGGTYTVSNLRSKATYVRHYTGNELKGTKVDNLSYNLTINYDANGGTIPTGEIVGEIYKITVAEGLNVRAEATSSSTKLGALAKGKTLEVTEKKTADGYTWGKITYKGSSGWVALDPDWVTKTGDLWNPKYYLQGSTVYTKSTSSILSQVCTYGEVKENGFYNCATIGLQREGYVFMGWSLTKSGDQIISQSYEFRPEELVPDLKNGNKTITVYAIWQEIPTVSEALYTVIFRNDDGIIISIEQYALGATITVPKDPTKHDDFNNSYKFAGWDKEVVTVCAGDIIYTATYTKVSNSIPAFKSKVAELDTAATMEEKYAVIYDALIIYGNMTDEDKQAVSQEYITLNNAMNQYNANVNKMNEKSENATKISFATLTCAGFSVLSLLYVLLKRKLWF